ncbi:MAG: GTPase [Candidatus Kariarchaeaceae archaeon]|jgi:GTPase Era involved in 16S rRNA processing
MSSLFSRIFRQAPKEATMCLVGEVNTGKSTLANRIAMDFAGENISSVSAVPHETRDIHKLEHLDFRVQGSKFDLTLVDTPGIATAVNYQEFMEHGMTKEDAMQRAKEATSGIVSSIKFLKEVDVALVLMDSTKAPNE